MVIININLQEKGIFFLLVHVIVIIILVDNHKTGFQ